MEAITKIPGLQHMSEDIFKLLDKKSLMDCRLVNSSWKNVLEQSTFWLEKLKMAKVPEDVQQNWKALAKKIEDQQIAKDSAKGLLEKFDLENLPSDVPRKWRSLMQELWNDNIANEFILILMKMFEGKQIPTLEIIINLGKLNKFPGLMKFMLENENPRNTVCTRVGIFPFSVQFILLLPSTKFNAPKVHFF